MTMTMLLCPSDCVRLSQVGVLSKQRMKLVFGMAASFDLSYTKMKFGYLQKWGVLPSGTLPQTLDLENLAMWQVNCVVNKTGPWSSL